MHLDLHLPVPRLVPLLHQRRVALNIGTFGLHVFCSSVCAPAASVVACCNACSIVLISPTAVSCCLRAPLSLLSSLLGRLQNLLYTKVLFGNVHSNANVIKISSFISAAGNVPRLKLYSFALPAVEPIVSVIFLME